MSYYNFAQSLRACGVADGLMEKLRLRTSPNPNGLLATTLGGFTERLRPFEDDWRGQPLTLNPGVRRISGCFDDASSTLYPPILLKTPLYKTYDPISL